MSLFAPKDADHIFNSPAVSGVGYAELLQKHLPLPNTDTARAVPGSAEPGYSAVFRNSAVDSIKRSVMPELNTFHALWKAAAAAFADKPALAMRPYDYATKRSAPRYVAETFAAVEEKKRALGAGLLHVLQHNPFKHADCEAHRKIDGHAARHGGFSEKNHSFVVTLYSGNRSEWVIADLACSAYSITNTVLYDTLGPSASQYILELVESPVAVLSYAHVETLVALKESRPQQMRALVCLVSMDPLDCEGAAAGGALHRRAWAAGIELLDMAQVYGVGRLFPAPELPPAPHHAYTISFTSGTTGAAPKGVVLTQQNAASGIAFLACVVETVVDDVEMAFLPLAHIFERQSLAYTLTAGGMCGFPALEGTPLTLVEDLRLLKPKHMANVPRVYTKFESAIKHATLHSDSAVKKALFSAAVGAKLGRQTHDGASGAHWLYDPLLIRTVRRTMGFDNMRYCITGSAPISPSTIKFMKAALNIGFSQGYGLTESFAGFSFSSSRERDANSCGAPGVCSEIRVRELPALGYTLGDARGPSGELEIRGHQIFDHYYKNPSETAAAKHDGWFATGDVARIDPATGRLYIVDRVKNFFKLAQGEYVTPEKVENHYLSANSILTQAFVHGNSNQAFLVAVVGVDKPKIVAFLAQCGVPPSELTSDDSILAAVNTSDCRRRLLQHLNGNISGLAGFEKIKNIHVEFEPLRLERQVITPTVKIRRPIAAKFFKDQIDAMYAEAELLSGSKL